MKKTVFAVLLCLSAASLSVAGYWEFEQVDTGSMGAGLHMRRDPAGRLCLAYYDSNTGQIRLATQDSTWLFEDPAIPPLHGQQFSFDIGPHGEVAAMYDTAEWAALYAWRSDTGWTVEDFPDSVRTALLIFDTAGVPNVVYSKPVCLYVLTLLKHAERLDSSWVFDTVSLGIQNYSNLFYCHQLAVDGANRLHAFSLNSWHFPPAVLREPIVGADISLHRQSDTGWQSSVVASRILGNFRSLSMALDSLGNEAVCYYGTGLFYYNGTVVDGGSSNARLVMDRLDRPHIAYVYKVLLYRYLDEGGWHVDTILSGNSTIQVGDIAFDPAGQPIVAYHVPGDGVWLAHGVDVVGTEETTNDERVPRNVAPTIVRGILILQVDSRQKTEYRAEFLDISGRKVMELKPGDNDVSRLAPGVYFVREAQAQAQAQAIRKVIVTR